MKHNPPRRFDKHWGYWWVKLPTGKWKLEHHYVWEARGNAPVPRGYVLHHRDENKERNVYTNLQLMTRKEHARLHATGRRHSEETKRQMRESALRVAADPEEKRARSERAKKQHAAGKLGAATWINGPPHEKMVAVGKLQADRLRKMIAATSSEEMSRRSRCRKIFQTKGQE